MKIQHARRLCFIFFFCLSGTVAGAYASAVESDEDAIRLNNDGVAWMNQQQTERAEAAFAQAAQKDPKLVEAELNHGISLLYLQKLPESEQALKRASTLAPADPRVWYNLGLVQRAANSLASAQASFEHAAELDPSDADTLYFEGVCLQDEKQFPQAIQIFNKALEKNPRHASAEFALARSLQRSGHADEAKIHFERFQHLTGTKISSALGLSYGDQGRYSTAVPVSRQIKPLPAMISVHFTLQSFGTASQDEVSSTATPNSGGACMIDVDGDGNYDLVLMRSGPSAIRILRNLGGGKFEPWSAEAAGLKANGNAVSCAVGDYDNDGLADLAVALNDQLLLFHNLGKGHFEDVTHTAGLSAANHPQGMTFVDYDHDGDVDLFVTGSPLKSGADSNTLWRNNGNRTFTDWTEQSGMGGAGNTRAAILSDVNNDRAVDLVVTGDGTQPTLYLNPREGKFPAAPLTASALPKSLGVSTLDYDKDGWMDLLVTQADAPGLTLLHNKDGKTFESVALPASDIIAAWGVTPIDIDNDGWIDIAAIVETKHGQQVRVFRNRGDGSFEDATGALGLDRIALRAPRGLIATDVDGDGAADLIVTSASGEPVWLRNEGGNRNHSVLVKLTGFADNKTGIGTKVDSYSKGNHQKWEIAGASGYLSQGPPEVLVGLGSADGIDLLRLLWPTGVPQDEISVARKPVVQYTEADRRGSSCPVLFAWDGKHYGLITDTIGAAVVGHWFTPARRNTPDSDEWIKVEGSQLAESNHRLSLRFTEPMEEVNYIDQLRLRAIDHPEGTEVFPDERFLDDPPFASGAVVVSSAAHLPAGAWDDHGRDALSQLAKYDHQFVSDFTKLPYDGFANQHTLTLDLGEPSHVQRLLLTGYVEYFSATSLYAAWQAGIKPISPYIEAQLPNGKWRKIGKEMGFPAGLERTIVVDLAGKLPPASHRIRIVSNLQIYWDQVLVDESTNDAAKAHATEIPLAQASLRFHGYPRQIDGVSPGDLSYDYDQVSLTGPFQRQRGSYTRFGDVTPLLTSVNNQFAIFGSGEELAAEFDASALPPLPPHWKRDYFFYANGYVKDMDFYDASPFTVSQLPFHGMSKYPYPSGESFPEDNKSVEYQLNWNDRFDSGNPSQSFRFDYQPRPSTPADTESSGSSTSSTTKASAHD
jgi:tetratricopeptide (TPR) repeat protein